MHQSPRLAYFFFFQAEDGIRDLTVTGVQTCALPISGGSRRSRPRNVPGGARCHSLLGSPPREVADRVDEPQENLSLRLRGRRPNGKKRVGFTLPGAS